jgi:hypothetical protein
MAIYFRRRNFFQGGAGAALAMPGVLRAQPAKSMRSRFVPPKPKFIPPQGA